MTIECSNDTNIYFYEMISRALHGFQSSHKRGNKQSACFFLGQIEALSTMAENAYGWSNKRAFGLLSTKLHIDCEIAIQIGKNIYNI